MMINDIAYCFNRAIALSFVRKKIWLVAPFIFLCSMLVVAFHLFSYTNKWFAMCFFFLPFVLSVGILLSLGVILIRVYYQEVKKIKVEYKKILALSLDVMSGSAYVGIPMIFIYVFLWILFGFLLLLQEIPLLGPIVASIFSFVSFMLICAFISLAVLSIMALFFAAPVIALRSNTDKSFMLRKIFENFKINIFANLFFFFIALFPVTIVFTLLSLAAFLTNASYLFFTNNVVYASISSFFMMIPFSFLISPVVIFFFNFAAEAYNYMRKSSI